MAGSIKIFVEGEADEKFISDYISYLYEIDISEDVIKLGGWEGIKDGGMINQFKKNTDNLGTNLIIIDADSDVEERRLTIRSIIDKNEITASLFLLPNNAEEGDLETLLERIINGHNSQIFDCWEKYEYCLSEINIEGRVKPLTIPAKKSKIYSYIEALVDDSNAQKKLIKDPNRNYKNTEHWNLESDSLSDLHGFFDSVFN